MFQKLGQPLPEALHLEQRKHRKCRNSNLRRLQLLRVNRSLPGPWRDAYKAVWNRATELISNATEIHAIGYSFSGIDRGPILEMLGQAHSCRRLVIQSPDADEICSRLKSERPELHSQIESAPFTF